MKRSGYLKRKTPIRRVSKRRAKEARIYLTLRKGFLFQMSCQACAVFYPDLKPNDATEVHHVKRRGKHYLDESSWLAICRPCHLRIETHPSEARKLGLLK